jgi:hypothetical protein
LSWTRGAQAAERRAAAALGRACTRVGRDAGPGAQDVHGGGDGPRRRAVGPAGNIGFYLLIFYFFLLPLLET